MCNRIYVALDFFLLNQQFFKKQQLALVCSAQDVSGGVPDATSSRPHAARLFLWQPAAPLPNHR